jgi:hypothetical protein
MGSVIWGEEEVAEVYDKTYVAQFQPPVLGPIVDLLARLARGGPALEFAAGTGRVALPLSARGVAVHGIELSPHMAGRLLAKPGAKAVPVTIGDMTTTRVPGTFRLVYLVASGSGTAGRAGTTRRSPPAATGRGIRETAAAAHPRRSTRYARLS